MENVMQMAGEFTAHAVWSVSSGGVLTPIVGFLKKDNTRCMQRLMMGSIDALALGEERISQLDPETQGATFIKDAVLTLDNGKTDALVVDIAFAGDTEKRVQMILPYRNAEHTKGFAVHRAELTRMDGLPQDAAEALIKAFFEGIDQHDEGKRIWEEMYVENPENGTPHYNDENMDFSMEDFETLKRSPFIIFFLVAAADGNIDKKEIKAFQRLLLGADKFKNKLLTRIITNVINEIPNIISSMSEQAIDYIAELRKLGDIADGKLPPDEANNFKISLFMMGKEIAEASGGFFGFGRKIGKEEKSALAAIALCLGIKPAQAIT